MAALADVSGLNRLRIGARSRYGENQGESDDRNSGS